MVTHAKISPKNGETQRSSWEHRRRRRQVCGICYKMSIMKFESTVSCANWGRSIMKIRQVHCEIWLASRYRVGQLPTNHRLSSVHGLIGCIWYAPAISHFQMSKLDWNGVPWLGGFHPYFLKLPKDGEHGKHTMEQGPSTSPTCGGPERHESASPTLELIQGLPA